jgi:hypothetical protein
MPTFRTLRCANAQLYIAATLIVLAAAAYVLCTKDPLWQQITAILAAIITPIWTAYYAFLRITVDTIGVTRRSLTGSTKESRIGLSDDIQCLVRQCSTVFLKAFVSCFTIDIFKVNVK